MELRLPDFAAARVLIAGDVMLDRYWSGETGRISPEAPVPVVRVGGQSERPGGAGNVALNVAALGAGATVLGVVGADEAGDVLEGLLGSTANVEPVLHRRRAGGTVTKLRILSRHQQLIRLDFEDPSWGIDGVDVAAAVETRLAECDVVVLSDYDKGTLEDPAALIATARAAGRPVLVDPKRPDFSVYRGATLLTPNQKEFEAAVGPCPDEATLVARARAVLVENAIEALLVTRGEQGMSLIRAEGEPVHIPARAREVFDVTGAGDTVVAAAAAALAAGLALADAARLANTAAGIVVGKLGAATVTVSELRRALYEQALERPGILDEAGAAAIVADARAHGERVVMTNGCFDILHAGHVAYLEAARALGDRLLVAVNDDESVRRLKGDGRPVNPLEQRMAVLAALGAVDWVVPFSEDTPERMVCTLRPDTLVKGGDYRPEEVAGRDCAGELRILDLVEGCSTSRVIESIRGDR